MKRTLLFAALSIWAGSVLQARTADDVISITCAADLVQFAADVNNGDAAQTASVELTQDIDMSNITDWTPIGNATFSWASNKLTITGNAFKGTFDGKGHVIKNFKPVCSATSAGSAYGLFGALDGATVRNFTIGAAGDDASALTVSASASTDCGIVAGLVNESTVDNITNYASLTYNGTASARVTLGMVGFVFCNENASTVSNLTNYGPVYVGSTGNTSNGATCIQGAGIAGFSTNDASSTVCNQIKNCTNYGDMESYSARTSGIVAAANRYTALDGCTNYGNQTNSFEKSGNGRLGAITCITGTGSYMVDCTNYGNIISTTSARCGGIVSLPNHAANTFDGCANYGEIITDDSYRGVFFGYNNMKSTWTNCIAGGKVGTYNSGSYVYDSYDEENQINYLGKQGSTKATITDVTYKIGETTAITTVAPSREAISTTYYNISGVRVTVPEGGIFIRQQKFSDGSIVTSKVVVR